MRENELLLSNYISLGSKVEVEAIERVILPDGTYGKKHYESSVMGLLDEEHIEIAMPIEKSKLVLLPLDGQYDLHFITPKGLFQCLARVTKRYKQDNLYLLEMELISDIQKYQRREYYRFNCSLELGVRELSPDEQRMANAGGAFEIEKLPFHKATTVDISGGGIRFVSETPFEEDSYVVCNFSLVRETGRKIYNQVVQILSCSRMEKNKTMYEHRVKFLFMNNFDREDIIRYIFESERKRRQREM